MHLSKSMCFSTTFPSRGAHSSSGLSSTHAGGGTLLIKGGSESRCLKQRRSWKKGDSPVGAVIKKLNHGLAVVMWTLTTSIIPMKMYMGITII